MEGRKGSKLSRRKFVQRSMMAGAAGTLLPAASLAAERDVTVPTGPNLYEKIGVRPLINAKGTYTIISGSLSLPEVKQAMEEAGEALRQHGRVDGSSGGSAGGDYGGGVGVSLRQAARPPSAWQPRLASPARTQRNRRRCLT